MLRPRLRAAFASSALSLALVASGAGATFANAATGDFTVGLHNTSAGAGSCPAGAPDGTYWHFVAPPKSSTDFQAITLEVGDEYVVIDDWIEHPLAGDVYVAVPDGKALTDLTGGTFVYTGGDGRAVRLSHTCTVGEDTRVEQLTITKTAVTSYQRAHAWSVKKAVDADLVKLAIDGSGDTTINYTVDVGYDGYTDSGWLVSGTVSIKNTGDLDASIALVEDTMTLGDGTYDITCDASGDIAVGATVSCDYSQAVEGAVDGVNDVIVTSASGNQYFGAADVTWGVPTSESDKTVSLSDTGDLLGTKDGGTFTAPNGGSFTYSADLAYADYGQAQCGTHEYGNIATLTGDAGVLGTASADVTVKVQCLVFKGDTAWADGTRYNKKGNWATFVTGEDQTVTLYAGQTKDARTVALSAPVDGMVTITVTLNDGWSFAVKAENFKVQGYAKAPSGNPDVGNFANKMTCDVGSQTCSMEVADANFYGIHLDVGQWMPDPNF